jgi:hypothetical protein
MLDNDFDYDNDNDNDNDRRLSWNICTEARATLSELRDFACCCRLRTTHRTPASTSSIAAHSSAEPRAISNIDQAVAKRRRPAYRTPDREKGKRVKVKGL